MIKMEVEIFPWDSLTVLTHKLKKKEKKEALPLSPNHEYHDYRLFWNDSK